MFAIDDQGLREKEIMDVKVDDYREIARFFTLNPKYENKSIYLIPDNYVHQLSDAAALQSSGKGDGFDETFPKVDFSEIKMKSGRLGRKVKKADLSRITNLYESIKGSGFMGDDDLDEYISALTETEPVKHLLRSAFSQEEVKHAPQVSQVPEVELYPSLSFSRNEFDMPARVGSEPHNGELVPMPITNFTKDQIDNIRLGKTSFYIQKKKEVKGNLVPQWKNVFVRGNFVDELTANGYNGEEVKEPTFIPYKPSGIEMVEITYIYGPNRSGKTYYAAKYATLWSEMFEEWPIYLFSRRDQDKVLDDIPALTRVKIDESLITDPLTMSNFEHSLVIFDDIDTIADKKIRVAIQKLRDDIMETGRQKMIYVINTSHLGANYAPTRTVLNEANSYTLFPRKGNYEHNFNILKTKMGMRPDVIRRIMDKPHGLAYQGKWGWITVYKDSPQYVMSEVGVHLL